LCTLEWYRLPDKKVKALLLIMAISDTSLNLKAGKFIDLSFKTLGNVSNCPFKINTIIIINNQNTDLKEKDGKFVKIYFRLLRWQLHI